MKHPLIYLLFILPLFAYGQVKPGIEVLRDANFEVLKGKRVGLITNPTGVDCQLKSTVDILFEAPQVNLVALYGPEHGVRGDIPAGQKVENQVDAKTGLKVHSLYGKTRKPTPAMLQDVDVLVYDIQDIGVRFFSYTYTMAAAMKACAQANIPFVVLDRYNPLGLLRVEGCLIDQRFDSEEGGVSLPARHAMTIGELARYINGEYHYGCDLVVVKCEGLQREMDYRDCNTPWIMPSPNCATYETIICYIGTVLFEGTNVSEGRGTVRPFELIGAPWLRNEEVVQEMERKALPGVRFRAAYFRPTFSKYQGQLCKGLQLHAGCKLHGCSEY